MKALVFLILSLPLLLFAQPDELMTGSPAIPEPEPLSIDLNHDGIAELQLAIMVEGTDDVPSSSGTFTMYLQPAAHCFLLTDPGSQNILWFDTVNPRLTAGTYQLQPNAVVYLMSMGYGHQATEMGWQRLIPEGASSIGCQFRTDSGAFRGFLQVEPDMEAGKIRVTGVHVTRVGGE